MLAVYDLQLLVDVLDLPKKGLDAVLESQLGVRVEGKKRYQRQNWLVRPLDEGARQYALNDVAHLFSLHGALLKKIEAAGLTEKLVFCMAASSKDWDRKSIPGIFKVPAYRKMKSPQKLLYEKIVAVRESSAEALNIPAHFVIPKQDLVGLSENPERIRQQRFGPKVSEQMRNRIIREVSALAKT